MNINALKNLNKDWERDFPCILVGALVFAFSYVGAWFYTTGDQAGYSSAYEAVAGLEFFSARDLYTSRITSFDMLHFFLVWLASSAGVSKIVLMSFLNGALATYSVRLFQIWGANFGIASMIVLTNFYMFVLYLAAERLKLGFLFLVLSFLYIERIRFALTFLCLAVLSHYSLLLFGLSVWCQRIFTQVDYWKSRTSQIFLLLVLLIAALPLYLFGLPQLLHKATGYLQPMNTFVIRDFMPITILFCFSVYYNRRVWLIVLMYLPMAIAFCLFGGSRINMLAYFLFLSLCLHVRQGLNFGVLVTSAYLAYKSFVFCTNIYLYGNGFSS